MAANEAAVDWYHEIKALFPTLDARYFAGQLSAAGWRVDVRNLEKPGYLEYYEGRNGEMRATLIPGRGG